MTELNSRTVKEVGFETERKGYRKDHVHSFLGDVSKRFEQYEQEIAQYKQKIAQLESNSVPVNAETPSHQPPAPAVAAPLPAMGGSNSAAWANAEAQNVIEKAQARAREMVVEAAESAEKIYGEQLRATGEKLGSSQEELARLEISVADLTALRTELKSDVAVLTEEFGEIARDLPVYADALNKAMEVVNSRLEKTPVAAKAPNLLEKAVVKADADKEVPASVAKTEPFGEEVDTDTESYG